MSYFAGLSDPKRTRDVRIDLSCQAGLFVILSAASLHGESPRFIGRYHLNTNRTREDVMTPHNSFRSLLKTDSRLVPSIRRQLNRTFAVVIFSLAAAMVVLASISFVSTWGTTGSGEGQFFTPTGIAVDASGNVFVCEGGQRVQKFNNNGVFQFQFGSGGSNPGQFITPSGIAVDSAGNIYVSDANDPTNRVSK